MNKTKESIRERVKPKPEVRRKQEDVDKEVTSSVWSVIDSLGMRNKIHDVQMQGSYAKGTDLAESGSDLDLFVIFKKDVPAEEREKLGIEIGMKSLQKYNPHIQTATTKYAEAFFEKDGTPMEVQVVPTRHLTLEEIKNRRTEEGEEISIGMERTPHQTAFMKNALKGKEDEVRILKQFMKDNGLYDSSLKSQGFSGYATEVLIHNLGSFENVINFFANFKKGVIIGNTDKTFDNVFSLIDPIDQNRDLISAFSPLKIARTVKVAKHLLEHGEPPKRTEPVELDSVDVTFKSSETNEDALAGKIRKSQNAILRHMKQLGFDVPVSVEKVTDDFLVEVPRTRTDFENGRIKLSFGLSNQEIPRFVKDKGMPINPPNGINAVLWNKKLENYRQSNPNSQFVEENGMLKAIKERPFTRANDALEYLLNNKAEELGLSKSIIQDLKRGLNVSLSKNKFENLI